MVDSVDLPTDNIDRIRSWAREKANVSNSRHTGADAVHPIIPLTNQQSGSIGASLNTRSTTTITATTINGTNHVDFAAMPSASAENGTVHTASPLSSTAPPPIDGDGVGEASSTIEKREKIAVRFYHTLKKIFFYSWLNVILVFVPIGIALGAAGINPTVVFAINAIAIIPLAALLSFATENVARKMGDTVGALMNVTFGNAVELIIFIALVKNEIRIVQASLLGSILSNLLLILGMCFLLGGLRYREQIYNSKVTQMSACLLSLSVMSLLLPTAFHASFTNTKVADRAVLQVSRGTSVILLLVYGLYLLFQLKSHSFMYASTPQHVIDEEAHPGVLADFIGSSASSDTSSSSSSSDSDSSSSSNTTAKRIKRVGRAIRGRTRRKSSASSKEAANVAAIVRNRSVDSSNTFESPELTSTDLPPVQRHCRNADAPAMASGDEADTDGEVNRPTRFPHGRSINFKDFELEKNLTKKRGRKKKKHIKKSPKRPADDEKAGVPLSEKALAELASASEKSVEKPSTVEHVSHKAPVDPSAPAVDCSNMMEPVSLIAKRPFNIRNLSILPALEKTFSTAMLAPGFSDSTPPAIAPGSVPLAPYGLRRTASLPDRLNRQAVAPTATSARPLPHVMPPPSDSKGDETSKDHISQTSAVILLLVSTSLVALCAEYLVNSIKYLVDNTGVSEAFVGLIILPIIGNAAEHVCAVTVAAKNKMDLAIGVAVGSSIQIALFVTPIVVLLGWALEKDMSLYFNLFETVSLFASAFIVNFLVLDGRSNYLEGALLCAAYVIIAVAAFFYPDSSEQSSLGGATGQTSRMMMKLL